MPQLQAAVSTQGNMDDVIITTTVDESLLQLLKEVISCPGMVPTFCNISSNKPHGTVGPSEETRQ
jgi:hypothetical protein